LLHKINPQYPIFGLGGIVIDEGYYFSTAISQIDGFKQSIFKTKDIILHSRPISKKEKEFYCLRNRDLWEKFNRELEALFDTLNFSVISVVIKKKDHVNRYRYPYCPYNYSLEILMEGYVKLLYRNKRSGYIIAESRGKREDNELLSAYNDIMAEGTRYLDAEEIRAVVKGFSFRRKSENINGLQISDLCINAITSAVLNNNYERKDFKIVKRKMDEWHGLKIRP